MVLIKKLNQKDFMKIRLHGLLIVLAVLGAVRSDADTVTWTNVYGNTWSNPLNWSPNRIPGPGDTAVIANNNNYYVISLDVDADVGGLILGGTNGTYVQSFLTGGQTLTVNGPIQVTAQGQLTVDGGTIAGTNSLTGVITGYGANFMGAMTVASNGVVNITSGNNFFRGMVLTNYGTVNWGNAGLLEGSGLNVSIFNFGLWNAQSDNSFQGGYGGGTTFFYNFGAFLKSGNAGATTMDGSVVFNNTGTIEIESGTLNIEGPGVNNGGNLTTTNSGILNLYSFAFTNSTTLIGGGSYLVGNASFGGPIAGTLTWVSGILSGALTLASNAVLNTVSGNYDFAGLIFTNYGTVNWTNATLLGVSGLNATIYNYGLWNAESDNTFSGGYNGGTSLFDNFGTFRKLGKTGITTLDGSVVFNNTGNVNVQNGTLEINAGTDSAGTANTVGTASLTYNNYTFAGGTTFTGAGAVVLTGNITMNGVMTAPNLQLNTATLTGTNVIIGTLEWSASSAAGIMTVNTNSVLNFVAGNNFFRGLIFTNYGTVNWTNGTLLGGNGANASIYNYGLWNAQSDNTFQGGYSGGTSLFDNFGTFLKSGKTGATLLDGSVVFNNTGNVNVQNGTLEINAGTDSAGTANTASNALLNYNNYTFAGGTTFTGAGAVVLTGNITMNGVMTAPNLQLNSATLTGTNVIIGTLEWSASSAAGIMTLGTNSVVNIVAGNNFFKGLVLTNYGTVNWTNGTLLGGSGLNATIYNCGLWNAQSDNTFTGGYNGGTSLFNNFGTFLKSGKTGVTTLDSAVVFNNTGTLDAQSGTLSLNGSYNLTGGTLQFGIHTLSNYGTISLAGAATLTGTVSASLQDGFIPAAGNSFSVLSYGSKSGNFISTVLPLGFVWTTNYGSTTYTITVASSLPPAPVTNLVYKSQSGQSFLQFDGSANASYTVLATTNLTVPRTNWIPLGQASLQNGGSFEYQDSQSPSYPQRFYQIRSP